MFTVFHCCPDLDCNIAILLRAGIPYAKHQMSFTLQKTNTVRTTSSRALLIFQQLLIVFCTCVQISSTCSVPHSLFNASHVETLPCCSVQCSVRIHLLYKFAWIFSKLTDPVWWLLNKSTPWLAKDLSCYLISSIKEEHFFQHDNVHVHLSVFTVLTMTC